jgi:hypothetical protein
MEEIEAPTEEVQEQIHHHAESAHQEPKEKWIFGVALSTALLAAVAAIAALLAGHHSNEAILEQIESSNQWSYYQAKGIKANLEITKQDLLKALGKAPEDREAEKIAEYKKEQEEIQKNAEEKARSGEKHLHRHNILANGVTLFQIAIAVAAISVLTKRKWFWYISMSFGLVGLFFLIKGLLVA